MKIRGEGVFAFVCIYVHYPKGNKCFIEHWIDIISVLPMFFLVYIAVFLRVCKLQLSDLPYKDHKMSKYIFFFLLFFSILTSRNN